MSALMTTSEFLDKCFGIHQDKYDYSLVNYTGSLKAVDILCRVHGAFSQLPKLHLRGHGCALCGLQNNGNNNNNRASREEKFKSKAFDTHSGRYDYSRLHYYNDKTPCNITCKVHGDFQQLPSNHLAGKGCPQCSVHGFKDNKSATLYYLKVVIDGITVFKIGITNNSIIGRFRASELLNAKVLFVQHFSTGLHARLKEKEILQKFKRFKYKGPPILHSGNTELFTEDVLKRDNL